MDHDDTPSRPAPAGWLEALTESEADFAAGRVESGEVIKAELRQAIAEMEVEGLADAGSTASHR